ncbi:MAG: hypothetical protein ABIK98_00940 [Pseudomonadota bacterium]
MIYIGNFLYVTDQQEVLEADRRHGEFSLIIEADSHETAVVKFKDRIIQFRQTKDLFQGDCRIFFIQLVEFDAFPKTDAVMLNYKSIVGDPFLPFIGCLIPTEVSDSCRIFDWSDNRPEIDGVKEKLFLEFRDDKTYSLTM